MASPQKENGHVEIANELFEALYRFPIPGRQRRIFDAILRKTWGWGKKSDHIPLSQLANETGIDKSHVCHMLEWLKKANMIRRDSDGKTTIQKDYETWVVPSKAVPPKAVPYKAINVASEGNTPVPPKAHSKEIGKRQERQWSAPAKKPYIEGDRAWQDPSDPNHWRVQTHSGEWVDYVGEVSKHLEWR